MVDIKVTYFEYAYSTLYVLQHVVHCLFHVFAGSTNHSCSNIRLERTYGTCCYMMRPHSLISYLLISIYFILVDSMQFTTAKFLSEEQVGVTESFLMGGRLYAHTHRLISSLMPHAHSAVDRWHQGHTHECLYSNAILDIVVLYTVIHTSYMLLQILHHGGDQKIIVMWTVAIGNFPSSLV